MVSNHVVNDNAHRVLKLNAKCGSAQLTSWKMPNL